MFVKRIKRLSIWLLMVTVFASSVRTALAANHTVSMASTSFNPVSLTIGVGDQVTWTNTSSGLGSTHTATRGDPVCSTNGFGSTFWNSGNMASKATYSFTFTNFAAGTYTYLCVQHCVNFGMKGTIIITNPPGAPLTVSITNPAPGTVFLAPANVTVQASASGNATNVQFLIGATVLANAPTAPYAANTNGLPAGNYLLSAIASDASGAKATNSVNISVLTSAILSNPSQFPNGQFRLTITGIAGQTYATEASSNLVNWKAIATNVAPANTFNVTDTTSTNVLLRFYRTRQDF